MDAGEIAFYGLVGLAAGAAGAGVVWLVASKQLDRQFDRASAEVLTRGEAELRQTIQREIPARVGQTIDQKLREAGITRETGQQLARVLDLADRVGLIGLRGRRWS